jgi:hypothetical protein
MRNLIIATTLLVITILIYALYRSSTFNKEAGSWEIPARVRPESTYAVHDVSAE